MGYRVVQWSTSAGGRLTLRGIIGHPDLELVGVWVDSDGELGVDAGELAGVGPIGVAATNDVAALLALIPDCVCFTAPADEQPQEALEDLTRILSSGANVISPRIAALRSATDRSFAQTLSHAAEEAAASLLVADIELPAEDDGGPDTASVPPQVMRLVNAIPAVCRAKPGLLSATDVPLEEPEDAPRDDRPNPPYAGEERETLNGFLDFLRATVERKVAGLDHAQIREHLLASSPLTTAGGVVKHLVAVERWWFSEVLGDGAAPSLFSEDDHDFEFRLTDGETAESLLADYAAECERSRAIVAAMDLGDVAERRREVSVRWVLTHMIEETARHVGHLDLLRESLDGATGE